MLQEEIADTQEGMIEDIVAVATIPGVVDIEVEEAMTVAMIGRRGILAYQYF